MQIKGTSIFAQMLTFINKNKFAKIVKEYKGDKYAKKLTCWDQLVSMMFCHLGQAKALREICNGLKSTLGKLSHLGVRTTPVHSTLAYANAHRPYEIYRDTFFALYDTVSYAWSKVGKRKFKFKNKLFSIDSTIIDLCLEMFDWAHFRRKKGAVKLHLMLDHDGYLPNFAHITDGKTSDVKALKNDMLEEISFPKHSIIVLDRGYNDYKLFSHWCIQEIYFVTKMKSNAVYTVTKTRSLPENSPIIKDEEIRLTGFYSKKKCPFLLRRIEVYDEENDRVIVLLTNNMKLAASTVSRIYRDRWEIEIFFKTIKQNLKIKTFVGTTPNAVKIQLWTALIAILLIKYLKMISSYGRWSMSNLIALLRFNLFSYRDLIEWINNPYKEPPHLDGNGQLTLSFVGQQGGTPILNT